jgi:diguanylate cyclase (GGDEF)-like protein/PAS domain S-box-containing protein
VVAGHSVAFRSLIERMPVVVYIDLPASDYTSVYVSPNAKELFGYPVDQWRRPGFFREILHPDDCEWVLGSQNYERTGMQSTEEYRVIRSDGSEMWVRDTFLVVGDHGGTPLYISGLVQDITDRKRAEQLAVSSERRFRAILEDMSLSAALLDIEGRITFCNDQLCHTTGWERERLLGKPFHETLCAEVAAEAAAFARAMAEGAPPAGGELRLVTRAGETRVMSANHTLLTGDEGELAGLTVIAEDVTERRAVEEQVRYLAHYDSLTRLPNRALFGEWLEMAMTCARETDRTVGVLHVSLDDFTLVNDALGHGTGDELLAKFADRLRDAAEGAELIARQSGDEFLVLLADTDPDTGAASTHAVAADVAQIAEALVGRLTQMLHRPFDVGGRDVYLTASVGVALFPRDAGDRDGLIKHALLDRFRSRDTRLVRRRSARPEGLAPADELGLIARLHSAIAENRFQLAYQPVVGLRGGQIVGVEALLRWRESDKLVSPTRFIPLAERTGLIVPITDWVIREVCRQTLEWRERGIDLQIAFNYPTTMWSENAIRQLLATVRTSGVEPASLLMEVTETTAMSDAEETEPIIRMLHESGLLLAVDDFGTGYSSLSRLKQLRASTLKIDRSFVRDLPGDQEAAEVVRTIVLLAHNLGMEPLAEGIETDEQREFLIECGCALGQGFLFSQAVSPAEIERFWGDSGRELAA